MADNGDRWMAADLEQVADEANEAELAIDWETLGAIEREARKAAAGGKLTKGTVETLMRRAEKAIPSSRSDVLEQLERDLRALL